MAGDKGKGKRSSLSVEQRGGEERGPKVRKVTQEEMGKRKGRLQIKGRDKPMELEKARRLEEKGRKTPTWGKGKKVSAEEWADFSKQMMEIEVAYFKTIVEQDYEYLTITEDLMPYHPRGPDTARALNAFVSEQVRDFKELAAARVKEYEEKGYIEGFPECRFDPDFLKLVDTGK